jgi:hypothetical protein
MDIIETRAAGDGTHTAFDARMVWHRHGVRVVSLPAQQSRIHALGEKPGAQAVHLDLRTAGKAFITVHHQDFHLGTA